MGNCEVHIEELAEGNLRRIIGKLHRLCVPAGTGTDGCIIGRVGRTTGITGTDVLDSLHMLEHRLHAPETTAGEHGDLVSFCASDRGVDYRVRQRYGAARKHSEYAKCHPT